MAAQHISRLGNSGQFVEMVLQMDRFVNGRARRIFAGLDFDPKGLAQLFIQRRQKLSQRVETCSASRHVAFVMQG